MGDLLAATGNLMAVPSLSGREGPRAEVVEQALAACPWLEVERVGDTGVARTALGHGRRLVLAGHLDTVPPRAPARPRRPGGPRGH